MRDRRPAAAPASRASGSSITASSTALQPLDLVAQPRRLLEFEVGGGRAHALFEIGDDRLQIVPDW